MMTLARAGDEVERRRPLELMRADANLAHPAARRMTGEGGSLDRRVVVRVTTHRHDDQRNQGEHDEKLVRKLLMVDKRGRWGMMEGGGG